MIEVELKARVPDPAAVEERLKGFARFESEVDKADSYWHGPDWRLVRGTKGFRVREEGGKAVVTFKTKRCEGGIEINREREFSVSDKAAFIELAERLGCEPFYKKRKRGKRYSDASGRITIELLEVDGLGYFLEIETLLEAEDPAALALAQGEIRGCLAKAGLPEAAVEAKSYSELLIAAGRMARP